MNTTYNTKSNRICGSLYLQIISRFFTTEIACGTIVPVSTAGDTAKDVDGEGKDESQSQDRGLPFIAGQAPVPCDPQCSRAEMLTRIKVFRRLGCEAFLIHLLMDNDFKKLPLTGSDRQYLLWTLREIIVKAVEVDISQARALLRWLAWLLRSDLKSEGGSSSQLGSLSGIRSPPQAENAHTHAQTLADVRGGIAQDGTHLRTSRVRPTSFPVSLMGYSKPIGYRGTHTTGDISHRFDSLKNRKTPVSEGDGLDADGDLYDSEGYQQEEEQLVPIPSACGSVTAHVRLLLVQELRLLLGGDDFSSVLPSAASVMRSKILLVPWVSAADLSLISDSLQCHSVGGAGAGSGPTENRLIGGVTGGMTGGMTGGVTGGSHGPDAGTSTSQRQSQSSSSLPGAGLSVNINISLGLQAAQPSSAAMGPSSECPVHNTHCTVQCLIIIVCSLCLQLSHTRTLKHTHKQAHSHFLFTCT